MSDNSNEAVQPNQTREHKARIIWLANRVIDAVEGHAGNPLGHTLQDAAVAREALREIVND